MLCDDLVSGNAVGHVLARHAIAIGSRKPESAAPVSFIGELVRASLHHRNIGLVTGERSKTFGEFVVSASLLLVRKPSLLGHAKSDAQKDAAPGRCGGSFFRSRSKAAKANRFQRGQPDQRSGTAEEVTAIQVGFHHLELW